MDVNAALRDFLDACEETETYSREEAIEALENILEWIRKGGFLPKVKAVCGSTYKID